MKDPYFIVLLHEESQNFVCFEWKEKLYQFVSLCFGLAPAPLVFINFTKIPLAVIRRFNGRIIIYLNDILIMAGSREELLILRDTLIFLFQNLDVLINFKKSVLDTCHMLEFLGLETDFLNMRVEPPIGKVEKIKKQWQSLLSVADLAKLTGRLSFTTMAILPVLSMRESCNDTVVLHKEPKIELDWWVQNLDLNNGRCILFTAPLHLCT